MSQNTFIPSPLTSTILKSPPPLPPTPTVIMSSESIEIVQVDNGYFIMPSSISGEIRNPVAVFNDFYELCNWLREHFGEPEINESP